MRPLLVLLVLAGCSHPAPAPEAKLRVTPCSLGTPQPPAPKPPRTLDSIVEAYNKAKIAGEQTLAALKDCAAKVQLLQQD